MNEGSTHNKSLKAQRSRVPLSDQQFAQASLALIQGWRQTFVAGSTAPIVPNAAADSSSSRSRSYSNHDRKPPHPSDRPCAVPERR